MRLIFDLIIFQWHSGATYSKLNSFAVLSTKNNPVWKPRCIAFTDSNEYLELSNQKVYPTNGWEIFPGYKKL